MIVLFVNYSNTPAGGSAVWDAVGLDSVYGSSGPMASRHLSSDFVTTNLSGVQEARLPVAVCGPSQVVATAHCLQ